MMISQDGRPTAAITADTRVQTRPTGAIAQADRGRSGSRGTPGSPTAYGVGSRNNRTTKGSTA